MLPSASWTKLLGSLGDHFGQTLDIDSETLATLTDYLKSERRRYIFIQTNSQDHEKPWWRGSNKNHGIILWRQGDRTVCYPGDIMLQDFLVTLVLAVIAFELIEHVLVPIFWLLLKGRKKSDYGTGGMKGKTVEIKCWEDKSGIVLFHAERWQAVSEKPMQPGEKAIVEEISGLTLKVKPYMETPED